MGTLANSEDPDEILQNAAFHQGLHCLLRENLSSVQEIQYFFRIITCERLVHTMDHSNFIVCSLWNIPMV